MTGSKPPLQRKRSQAAPPLRTAFTLVEMLVVIAIIAVLVAILLPALTAARQQANQLKCMSNLRSIMQAVFYYASENRNAVVPAYWASSATNPSLTTIAWPSGDTAYPSDCYFLSKYTDNVSWDAQHWPTSFLNGYIPTNSIWHCPEDVAGINGSNLSMSDLSRPTSYAMNSYQGAVNTSSPPFGSWIYYPAMPAVYIDIVSGLNAQPQYQTGWDRCIKMNQIVSPARCMGFVDNCGSVLQQAGAADNYALFGNPNGAATNAGGAPDTPFSLKIHAIRHPHMSTNMSFWDGHVENIQESLYTGIISGKSYTWWSLHNQYESGRFAFSYVDQ